MYTITFYSFKGGVGRTLALVNVAAELARMGRKVLLVDFDLEAPGLETFDHLRPPDFRPDKIGHSKEGRVQFTNYQSYQSDQPGMVEYVTEYLRTHRAPDVRGYVYSAGPVGKESGQLWVMPAGCRDDDYQSRLANIDWLALYREHDGFLLFEDTKAQWEQQFKPDYVLVDSRTGHTDVEGICTRQLPDAVAMVFFPNEQNLVGLRVVCDRIRSEASRGLMKQIRLHFVMSNVPDMADKEGVLRRRLEDFDWKLELELDGHPPHTVIHRCESALHFNQAIFVLDKPKSRLANEYQNLVWELIAHNPADRDGALLVLIACYKYLSIMARRLPDDRFFSGDPLLDQTDLRFLATVKGVRGYKRATVPGYRAFLSGHLLLDQIANKFPEDPEIQRHVVRCRKAVERLRAKLAAEMPRESKKR